MKLIKHKSPLFILLMVICAAVIVIVPIACNNGSSGGDGDTLEDTTPPTVMSTQPGNGDTDIAPNSVITVTFSEAMDESTITIDTVTVTAEPDPDAAALAVEAVAGIVSYTNLVATFTPGDDFVFGSLFTVRVTTGVTDLAGNGLAQEYIFTFTTGEEPDTTAPEISSHDPGEDETGVDLDVQVTVEFSEPVSASTVSGDTIMLRTSGYEIPSEVTLSPSGLAATLAPDSELAILADYEVTVSGDIEDLAGNKLGDDVTWGFQTREGSWGSTIQSYNTVNGYIMVDDPSVAFHGAGKANLLWAAFDPEPYAYFTESAGYDRHEDPVWEAESDEHLSSQNSGTSSTQPYIASDWYGGTSFGVWLGGGTYSYVYAKRFTSGEWETSEPQVSSGQYDDQPVVGVDGSGNAVALWTDTSGDDHLIYSSVFSGTPGSWSTPEPLTEQHSVAPWIAVHTETGEAVGVWVASDGEADFIYGAIYDPAGGWDTPEKISTALVGRLWYSALPQVALDYNGNAIAVWHGSEYKIWANRYRASAESWQGEVAISSEEGYNPDLGVDLFGNAIAVWENPGGSQIFFNRYDHGVTWPTWETTEAEAGAALSPLAGEEYVAVPQIAFDVAGNGMVVWEEDGEIKVKRYPHGLTLDDWKYSGDPDPYIEILSGDATNESPAIGLGPNGRAIAVWSSWDGPTIQAVVFE